MFKKIFILLLAIAMSATNSFLLASETVSLSSLIDEAKKNNPEILAAKKQWQASQARIPIAKSLDDPSITLEFEKIPKGSFKLNKTDAQDRMLSFSQFLPFFGKLPLKGKIAFVESQMFAQQYKDKELEIVNGVSRAYYELFLNYKEIELEQQSLKLLESISRIAEAKYKVGGISQGDLFKINLEIARLSSDIVNLKTEQDSKKTRLNAYLNRNTEGPIGEPAADEDASFTKDIKLLYLLTLENQPVLRIFNLAIEKNQYAKKLAKRSFFPDLLAEITQRGITSGTIGPWDLMLAFTVPIWFWTKQRYQVKEAIANLEEAKAAYEAIKNRSLSETKYLANRLEIAKNKIRLYKDNMIPILESSIESSIAGFRSNKSDLMALLDNLRMLIETKMDYYKALVEYHINLADLERAVGSDLKMGETKK